MIVGRVKILCNLLNIATTATTTTPATAVICITMLTARMPRNSMKWWDNFVKNTVKPAYVGHI
jgi:hypothetical protein